MTTAVLYRDLGHVREANEAAGGSFFADPATDLYRNLMLLHGQYLVSSRWSGDNEVHTVYRVDGRGRIRPAASASTFGEAQAQANRLAGR